MMGWSSLGVWPNNEVLDVKQGSSPAAKCASGQAVLQTPSNAQNGHYFISIQLWRSDATHAAIRSAWPSLATQLHGGSQDGDYVHEAFVTLDCAQPGSHGTYLRESERKRHTDSQVCLQQYEDILCAWQGSSHNTLLCLNEECRTAARLRPINLPSGRIQTISSGPYHSRTAELEAIQQPMNPIQTYRLSASSRHSIWQLARQIHCCSVRLPIRTSRMPISHRPCARRRSGCSIFKNDHLSSCPGNWRFLLHGH